jgi:hypothetical protein
MHAKSHTRPNICREDQLATLNRPVSKERDSVDVEERGHA